MSQLRLRTLIVDDEIHIREGLKDALASLDLDVHTAATGDEALRLVREEECPLLLTDLRMPGGVGGLELLRRVKELRPDTIVIVITAFATVDGAVEAMRLGAYDFITKPLNLQQIRLQVRKAVEKLTLLGENERLRRQLRLRVEGLEVVATSPAMKRIMTTVEQVAGSDATVLLQGESGTGKEVLARVLHARSPRKAGAFVAANCGALPESLFESEIFGHEAGAFTGARQARRGLFEQADGGTLFLDEVTEIPEKNQVALLRVIQERELRRVGSERKVAVDVRLIAASNRDVGAMVREGKFREDLFYRLNVLPLTLPPLRERREDIPLLAEQFLEELSVVHGKGRRSLSTAALRALLEYAWPGNIRQLRNVLERAVITTVEELVTPADLPEDLRCEPSPPSLRLGDAVRRAEREAILQALDATGKHKERAAKLLGISVRTLHYKIRELGLA
ncbi:MAG: sigma-54-dependent Fis family transcriptional regulator [Planctomycetes bacterium]|nr:sigma-54-dependent Fis family transcriptional regulator [Planctomycetota bacterium]